MTTTEPDTLETLDKVNSKPTLGLVLPGGGARAAYQAGALKAIAEMCPSGPTPFAVITGQSAGTINAASLASRANDFQEAVRRMVISWSMLSVSNVIKTDLMSVSTMALRWALTLVSGGWLVDNPRSVFDNSPLGELLKNEVDFEGIERSIEEGHLRALGVTTTSYAEKSGYAVTFFAASEDQENWYRERRYGLRRAIAVEHLMASAALPFLFPAHEIEGQFYGDGALRLAAPLSPAIHLGADRLLIIAIRDPETALPPRSQRRTYPRLGEIAGHLLDIVFNDHLDSDIERLQRINKTHSLLSQEQQEQTALRPIDVMVLRPSKDIRSIAQKHAPSLPFALRLLLRGVGGWGGDWRLSSYLNFNSGYCRELMQLGYKDTKARQAELEAFMSTGHSSDHLETDEPNK